jgi:DNA-binding transcriptional ArsR family regulator
VPDKPPEAAGSKYDAYLKGTTYRVYRFMLRQRDPVGISDIQKALGLSSSSVAEYHVGKLLQMGLVKDEKGGYVIDKVVVDNVVRIRRVSVPVQTAYVLFFAVTLSMLLVIFRPAEITSAYFLALAVNVAALLISMYEAWKTLKRL